MATTSGANILIESLKHAGVEYIFGVNGGAAMPIFDALYDAEGISLIPMRHEQGAAHAADGYARATGKVGVTLATSGPWCNKPCHRHCNGFHGFHTDGGYHRPSLHPSYRQ